MSAEPHPRRALVLGASAKVVEQARRLGFHGVLENAVERAIAAGELHGARRHGDETPVYLREHGVVVVCRRTRSPLSGRRCWLPIACRRLEDGSRAA